MNYDINDRGAEARRSSQEEITIKMGEPYVKVTSSIDRFKGPAIAKTYELKAEDPVRTEAYKG